MPTEHFKHLDNAVHVHGSVPMNIVGTKQYKKCNTFFLSL